jgi:hypothetical protein
MENAIVAICEVHELNCEVIKGEGRGVECVEVCKGRSRCNVVRKYRRLLAA